MDSVRRLQSVLDTVMDGIITIDEMGIIQSFNHGAELNFGYTAAEVIGKNVKILMPAEHAADHDAYLQRYRETGESHIIGIGRETTGRRKDGSEIPIDLAVGEFMEDGRRYFTGFVRDISDRKAAQLEARVRHNQLTHAARLNSMGELAAGIAHEVNQPLTAIVTMAQAMLRHLHSGTVDTEMLTQTLEKIIRQGERASGIIQRIRDFLHRDRRGDRVRRDVNDIVGEALDLFGHEFDQHRIRVAADLAAEKLPARVLPIQIEQVVVNLVHNAIQAMADVTGEHVLSVRTRMLPGAPPRIEVSVCDTGHGLPEGEVDRVFEPFFTTRRGGLGQGLSISRSIVEMHDGEIHALRNDGPGSTFVFTIPATPDGGEP